MKEAQFISYVRSFALTTFSSETGRTCADNWHQCDTITHIFSFFVSKIQN